MTTTHAAGGKHDATSSSAPKKQTLAGLLAKANRAARQARPKLGSLVEVEGQTERFVVISLASEKVERDWNDPPVDGARDVVASSTRPTSRAVFDVPAGFHVQGVTTGTLATFPESALKLVGAGDDIPLPLF